MEGKGKEERMKREKVGRGWIAVGDAPSCAHFDFPPLLPAKQATQRLLLLPNAMLNQGPYTTTFLLPVSYREKKPLKQYVAP